MAVKFFKVFSILLFVFLHTSQALVHVTSPPHLAKYYSDAPLNLYPRKFNLTGQFVLADPIGVCDTIKNPQDLVGKIVFIKQDSNCDPLTKQKRVYNAGAAGMVIYSTGDGGPHLGYLYTVGDADERVQLPSINIAFAPELLIALQNGENVTVEIGDTDYNPWVWLGKSAAGVLFQLCFEIYAFVCLVLAGYRSYGFYKVQGPIVSVTQSILVIEMIAAIFRILWFIQPISWGYGYLGEVADAFLTLSPNTLTLISTLMVTFYWHEMIRSVSKRLNARIVHNIDKMKIPFFILCTIILILEILGSLGRSRVVGLGDDAFTLSAIFQLIVTWCITAYFFYVGFKIFKVTSSVKVTNKTRKLNRLSLLIVGSCCLLVLGTIGIILWISPANEKDRGTSFFIWIMIFFSYFSVSFCKIFALVPPSSSGTSSPATSSGERKPFSDDLTKVNTTDLGKTTSDLSKATSEDALKP